MKILAINGSPRDGNTQAALQAFSDGARNAEVTIFDLSTKKNLPCEACNACSKTGKCKHKDASNEFLAELEAADAVLFATPVYWWGVTAQLKAAIDKLYTFHSIGYKVPRKKIGVLSVGALKVGAIQYELIAKQFECICDYLKWDVSFSKSICAYDKNDLKKNTDVLEECGKLSQKFE